MSKCERRLMLLIYIIRSVQFHDTEDHQDAVNLLNAHFTKIQSFNWSVGWMMINEGVD